MNKFTRTVLFWMFILLIVVVLWKGYFRSRESNQIDYSELLQLIENSKLRKVYITQQQSSSEVFCHFADSTENVFANIPNEKLPEITGLLKEKGIVVEFVDRTRSRWGEVVLNLSPFLLLMAFWLFVMWQMKKGVGLTGIVRRTRSGIAYDLHCLESGRKLILGGVELNFDKGPAGHSDGDVLAHAICDALLGAAGAGDIGTHFPDTDPQWRGVSSLIFLERTRKLLDDRKLRIVHIDAVVITERPKLGLHFPRMKETLARALGIQPGQINLKAKTNEGVDSIGRGEAIACHAIATLEE
jgi:2-C-methyl-D-erythritol 2,4-cyclodiphosphate synthase